MSSKPSTRASVPAPKRRGFLPMEIPEGSEAANNMKGERIAPMTFNMPRDWHTRFKVTAASRGMNMKELLIECFAAWEREQAAKARNRSPGEIPQPR